MAEHTSKPFREWDKFSRVWVYYIIGVWLVIALCVITAAITAGWAAAGPGAGLITWTVLGGMFLGLIKDGET